MPVTRGRARLNVSQEERIEQELAQKLPNAQEEREEQEEQEEQEEEDHQMSTEVEAPGADIRNMAKQLTKTLKHLLTTHRCLHVYMISADRKKCDLRFCTGSS